MKGRSFSTSVSEVNNLSSRDQSRGPKKFWDFATALHRWTITLTGDVRGCHYRVLPQSALSFARTGSITKNGPEIFFFSLGLLFLFFYFLFNLPSLSTLLSSMCFVEESSSSTYVTSVLLFGHPWYWWNYVFVRVFFFLVLLSILLLCSLREARRTPRLRLTININGDGFGKRGVSGKKETRLKP